MTLMSGVLAWPVADFPTTQHDGLRSRVERFLSLAATGVGVVIDLRTLGHEAEDTSPVSEADQVDIAKTLNGDGQAYSRIVSRYQDQISAQMWRLSRQRADCEQLVHEVFVEAYLSLRAYKARAPFLHWLRRIATRVGYRYWKQQARLRRQSSVPIQDWHRSVEPVNNDSAEAAAAVVHGLLGELPPRDRLVLTLIYLEGCSVAQAAEMSGWSQTMVKVQAHRARKKLKKLLDERQIDEKLFER
ncbi:MAG TPA: RNA polymerase sigma factor [Pirellulales bacterium]|nr:RNA polymerase sigma factor [Pirellulales bacterium]